MKGFELTGPNLYGTNNSFLHHLIVSNSISICAQPGPYYTYMFNILHCILYIYWRLLRAM